MRLAFAIIRFLMVFASSTLSSQNFQWVNWSPRPGVSSDFENFNKVAVDPDGNSFLAVQFAGNLTIGNYSFESNFVEDICILKYAPNGDFIWAKAIGSQYWDQVNGMDCDEQGNLYITGHYFGVLWYENDSLVGNAGGREMFLMKILADGQVAWAVNGANVWDDDGRDVRAMPGGGVIMCGRAHDTGHIGNLQLNNPNLLFQEFIAYFDDNGIGQWIRGTNPSVVTYSNSKLEIGSDSSIVIAYSSGGPLEVNGDTLQPWYYPEFSANQDLIVQKFSRTGDPIWGWIGGSLGQDLYGGLTIDNLGRVYFTMNSPMTSWFGQDSLSVIPGYWSSTVYRLNSDGSEDTAWHFHSSGFSSLQDLTSDSEGNIWVGGIMRDTLYTSFATVYTPNVNSREAMLYRINSTTNLVDRFDKIYGTGWYSILDLEFNEVTSSILFGGNGTASNAAPGTFGLGEDLIIGFSSSPGNWAYIGSFKADSCENIAPLTVSDTLLCPGQTATLSSQQVLYYPSWSNGSNEAQITINSAAEIQYQAIDSSGCLVNLSASVESGIPVQFTATTTNLSCFGSGDGAIDVSLTSGMEPVNYSWSNGQTTQDLTSLSAGSYNLTATSAQGCSKNQSFTISQPQIINAVLNESNGTLTLTSITGGTPPYSYAWENYPDETGTSINFSSPGSYAVTITDSHGCTGTQTLVATSTVDITNRRFAIFPNPTSDALKIEHESGANFTYRIYSSDGRLVLTGNSIHGNTIQTNDWQQGIYLIQIEESGSHSVIKRFEIIHP
jgi:hypothetical protein